MEGTHTLCVVAFAQAPYSLGLEWKLFTLHYFWPTVLCWLQQKKCWPTFCFLIGKTCTTQALSKIKFCTLCCLYLFTFVLAYYHPTAGHSLFCYQESGRADSQINRTISQSGRTHPLLWEPGGDCSRTGQNPLTVSHFSGLLTNYFCLILP